MEYLHTTEEFTLSPALHLNFEMALCKIVKQNDYFLIQSEQGCFSLRLSKTCTLFSEGGGENKKKKKKTNQQHSTEPKLHNCYSLDTDENTSRMLY